MPAAAQGKREIPESRKGRCTDDNRPPLNYEVKLTGPLQATFTGTCIQRTPPKPSCPPTLGEPFSGKTCSREYPHMLWMLPNKSRHVCCTQAVICILQQPAEAVG